MTNSRRFLAGALALTLAGCGGTASRPAEVDPFAAGTPDVSGLTLELQGGEAEGTTPAGVAEAPPAANDLQQSQAALRELNGVVGLLVGKIAEAIQSGGPPPVGDVKTYGPAELCVVGDDPATCTKATFLLTVTRVRDDTFAWRLEGWPIGQDPAAPLGVSVGWMARSELEHRGTGRLVLDLDHLSAIVPEYTGRGALLAGFASGPMGKAATYRLRGFTPDPSVHPPVFLTIGGFRNEVTATSRARVAALREVVPPPEGEADRGPELTFTHFAWNAPLGGRAFGIVTNWYNPFLETLLLPAGPFGDVPYVTRFDEHYLHVRACYAPFTGALVFRQSFLCNGAGSDAPEPPPACVARVGSANGAVLFPAEPTGTDTWEHLCALDPAANPGLAEPTGDPSTNPDDGEGVTDGLDGLPPPPAPPADVDDVEPPAVEG